MIVEIKWNELQCLNLRDGYIGFIILFYFYNVGIVYIKNVVYINKL